MRFLTGCCAMDCRYGADSDFKSSTTPQKVDSLEGATVSAIACSYAHTVWLPVPFTIQSRPPEPFRSQCHLVVCVAALAGY